MTTRVTLALERYDRHVPFFLGQLSVPPHIDLTPLEVGTGSSRRDGANRHGRMLQDQEFDAAEVSLASYIIAKARGAPFSGIPVFPRRLFSQNHIFVRDTSNFRHPADLSDKRVVLSAFQVTMSVLAKGDMQRDYGLNWRSVEWLTMQPEEIAVPDLPIRQLPNDADPVELLQRGDVDALIFPQPPDKAMSRRYGVRRLFEDPASECEGHFQRYGYLPIMHLIAIKDKTVRKFPELPVILTRLWEEAKALTNDYYRDPGFALGALTRLNYERQKQKMSDDVWPSGIIANKDNLDRFMADMVDQRLIREPVPVEELFHHSVMNT